jgi:hypothetical protein
LTTSLSATTLAVLKYDDELVCWLPNWHVERRERDPESTLTARLFFRPPVERTRRVTIRRGEKCSVTLSVSAEAFAPTK